MKRIYLDNQSNTKIDEKVFETMLPYFIENYGNPQSIYSLGSLSKDALDTAREQVSEFIGSTPQEVIFTSCGTESNNLAIKGIANAYKSEGKHIIVSAIEHFSVLNAVKRLEKEGFEITYIPVDSKVL